MATTVLVTDAGKGATNNLIRSLRQADPTLVVVGCHDDRFVLKNSSADRNVLVPPPAHSEYARSLRAVVDAERVDVVIPNSDQSVELVAGLRARLRCRTLLPAPTVLRLCRDKYRLNVHLAARGIPVPATYPVTGPRQLAPIFRRLAPHSTLWCRMRTGAGSMGATPVRTPSQAQHWIDYWARMRGVPPRSFTISEYLPGRDFACQSLWKDGDLVLVKTVERLSYFGGWSRPSGVSSIAALAKTVVDPRVVEITVRAIRTLGPRVTGAFSVDLKENTAGTPCITEINAGRFITMLNLFDFTGKHNMSATYLRLALGEDVGLRDEYDAVEDWYFIRDVDTPPAIFHADELFESIVDARRVDRSHAVHRRERRDRWES